MPYGPARAMTEDEQRTHVRDAFKRQLALITHLAFAVGFMQRAGVDTPADLDRQLNTVENTLDAYMDMFEHLRQAEVEAKHQHEQYIDAEDNRQRLADQVENARYERKTEGAILAAAQDLFDNRLGYSEGRNPYAPRELWAELGGALYGQADSRVRELRDPTGPHVETRADERPCECGDCCPENEPVNFDTRDWRDKLREAFWKSYGDPNRERENPEDIEALVNSSMPILVEAFNHGQEVQMEHDAVELPEEITDTPVNIGHDHPPDSSCGPECEGADKDEHMRDLMREAFRALVEREPQGASVGDMMLAAEPVVRQLRDEASVERFDKVEQRAYEDGIARGVDMERKRLAEIAERFDVPDGFTPKPVESREEREQRLDKRLHEAKDELRREFKDLIEDGDDDRVLSIEDWVGAAMLAVVEIDKRGYNQGFESGYVEGHAEGFRIGRAYDRTKWETQGWSDELTVAALSDAIARKGGVGGLADVDDLARAVLPIVRDSWVHGYAQHQHEQRAASPDLDSVRNAVALMRSIIESGESWTEHAQRTYDKACEVLDGNSGTA